MQHYSCMGMISWCPSSQAVSGAFRPLLRCCLGLPLSLSVPCCVVVSGWHYRLASPASLWSRAAIFAFRPLLRCGLGLPLSPSVPCCVVVPGWHYRLASPATMWSLAAIITFRPLLRCGLGLPLSPCSPLHGLYARGGLHAYDIYACWRLGEVYGYALCGPHVLVCLCVA